MKIVVIGNGKVGSKLSQQLAREGHDIVVIDSNAKRLQSVANTEDVMCIEGNAVDYAVQQEAGISQADIVIACTEGDELNMLCCLLAKKHGAKRTIARVRNPEYYDQLPYIRDELGLSLAINPERVAADTISRVLLFPSANNVEPFVRGRVELIEFLLEKGNPLIGHSLIEVQQKYAMKVLICAICRDGKVIIPGGSDSLMEGDRIHLVSSHEQIRAFFKNIDRFRSSVRTVMIVGGGKIAYYLARRLLNQGIKVKIIEQNPNRCRELCEKLPEAIVIQGDGTNEELLDEEGMDQVDAFVALTGLDEVNVILSIYVKTRHVASRRAVKVITKVTQLSFIEMLEDLGIESIISPKALTANVILRYVRSLAASADCDGVETLSRLVDGQVEALEFVVRKETSFLGIPLHSLSIRSGFLVACIVRRGQLIIPGGNDPFELGDSVIIVTTHPHVQSLQDMIHGR